MTLALENSDRTGRQWSQWAWLDGEFLITKTGMVERSVQDLPEDNGIDIVGFHPQIPQLVDQTASWPNRITARPVII